MIHLLLYYMDPFLNWLLAIRGLQGKYVGGLYEGHWKEWHFLGNIKCEGMYVAAKKNGVWREWNRNGMLSKKETYDKGVLILFEYYLNSGKKHSILQEHYMLNTEYKCWYNSEQLQAHGFYVNGKKHGDWNEWYKNGVKKIQCSFENGEQHGDMISWYENGVEENNSRWNRGKLHGTQVWWYNKTPAQKITEATYITGMLHGEFTNWHENGQIKKKVVYVSGKIQGKCMEWNENGSLWLEGDVKNGALVGEWKTYLDV